jgi:predicted AAA+ superfamily ATPase
VRNVGNFARFLEAISFSHGSQLNATAVARECSVERKTVEGYISILEDLLLCFRLPVFSRRAQRRLVAHLKFYYCDAGVFRSLRPSGPLDRPEEIAGSALEGLVAQHLRAWNAYSGERNQLYYWRTKSGIEVDFVVYGPDCFLAIEVKNTRKISAKDVKALMAFKQDYPEAGLLLLYRGQERMKIKEVQCVPCEEFLMKLVPGKRIAGGL